jgi:hypothetical protein
MSCPMEARECKPGQPAPYTGEYEQLAVGTPTGWSVYIEKGKPLPSSPRGYTWRHVPAPE